MPLMAELGTQRGQFLRDSVAMCTVKKENLNADTHAQCSTSYCWESFVYVWIGFSAHGESVRRLHCKVLWELGLGGRHVGGSSM